MSTETSEADTIPENAVPALDSAAHSVFLYALIWLAIGSNLLSKTPDSGCYMQGHISIILNAPVKAMRTGIRYMLDTPYIQSVEREIPFQKTLFRLLILPLISYELPERNHADADTGQRKQKYTYSRIIIFKQRFKPYGELMYLTIIYELLRIVKEHDCRRRNYVIMGCAFIWALYTLPSIDRPPADKIIVSIKFVIPGRQRKKSETIIKSHSNQKEKKNFLLDIFLLYRKSDCNDPFCVYDAALQL